MNHFQVIQPSVLLAPYVKQYWFVRMDKVRQGAQRIVPMGCAAFIFYRGNPTCSFVEKEETPRSLLYGINTRYTDITFSGDIDFIGVIFQPAGVKAFFKMPPGELADRFVSLAELNDPGLQELEQRLNESIDVPECTGIIERFLFRRIYQVGTYEDNRINTVMDFIRYGETDLSALAASSCLGYKQFRRLFTGYVGITPKNFLRIMRFRKIHHFLQRHTTLTLDQLAEECGYYDKSHLIKELKSFSGFTPAELSAACDPVYSGYHALFRSAFVDLFPE